MLLGFFFLIAKYLNLKIGQEGESGNIQKGAELLGKEKLKLKEKERRREKGVSDKDKYNFKESGIGNSWLIGDDTGSDANAYVKGMSGCEETLIIPHNLTDENQNTKYVEVIGQYAFNRCGDRTNNRITRSIVLSRYIKVIKYRGLGRMDDVTSFRIEEGSCLERIESNGLSLMSWQNTNESDRRSILVLPSTVTSIAVNGLYQNNPIKTIYYCGSTHLSNYSDLEYGISNPDIKVTSSYTYNTIFERYTPNKNSSSIAEAKKIFDKLGVVPTDPWFPGEGKAQLAPLLDNGRPVENRLSPARGAPNGGV